MKKNLFLMGALLVGMTMATGCSNEDVLEQNQGNLTVVKATIDNGSNTRTSVNELYQVVWGKDDAFTVFNDGTQKGNMTLQGEGGATTGDFEGTLNLELAEGDVALFPAVGTDVTAMTYTFQNQYKSTETDAPLYGTYNGTSFTFEPLSAVIRVNASGLTANTEYVLTITSTGDEVLTGEATLGNNNVLVPTGNGKTITVTLTPAQGATSLTFDAPIPAQTYTGLTITLKAGDAEATTLRTLANFEAKVGNLYEATEKVSSSNALKAALIKGGNVDIESSFELSEDMTVSENTILDLNNQTLTTGDKTITVAAGKILTIQNAATLARSANGPSITGSGDIITASTNSTIIIGEGVNLESTANCCIFVPANTTNVNITTSGNLKTSGGTYATVYVNGTNATADITVNGGSIEHVSNTAMYLAGGTSLVINGGTITGITGVEIRGGSLKVTDGTITATGNPFEAENNDNGSCTVGAAVAVCQHTTNQNITAEISGGKFVSENGYALYEADLQADDMVATGVTLKVEGGDFNGKVYSATCANFITGGTFSDASAFDYLADGADVSLGNDLTISKAITVSAQNVKINLGSYDVTATQTDAFEVTGSLTIEGSDDAVVKAGTVKENTGSVCAVWAHAGGSVTIDGGHYIVCEDKDGKRNDCIYAGYNANNTSGAIVVNGGKFEYGSSVTQSGIEYNGHLFLLNCADTQPNSRITVNGGFFKNHVPSMEANGTNEVVLGTDKNVYKDTTTKVTTAHDATSAGDIWYEVK